MKVSILASGSKGNLTMLKSDNNYIMIDVGLSLNKIKNKFNQSNIQIDKIKNLLITHEHQDHVVGLKGFLKLNYIENIYLTVGTYQALKGVLTEFPNVNINFIKADEEFEIFDLKITPVMLFHDANEPVGFVFNNRYKKFVLITDTGYINDEDIALLSGADLYLLEANHDPNLLMNSRRPFMLKKRIVGPQGHLSNTDACIALNQLIKGIDKTIWVVSHISEDCNTVLHIEKDIVKYIDDPTKIDVIYSSQESMDDIIL